ncbi:MAG: DUF1549 domain-containing protein [Verrucomicrobia bacterium]|nr:DUF1549 domain-containing protein [Verrucomicrobiota bacterium]
MNPATPDRVLVKDRPGTLALGSKPSLPTPRAFKVVIRDFWPVWLLAGFITSGWFGSSLRAETAQARSDRGWNLERNFWAFQRPVLHPRPAVQNIRWPRQPVDYFVLARMEQEGLSPSPQAPRAVLARRLALDLTGLPVDPEDLNRFLKDRSPGAVERFVDPLLSSPRFGERWASVWLPLARYAEDQAHQVGADTKYFYPNAWKYRRWVIDAFNRDLPYDRFLSLQLAADRIDGTNSMDLAALGFLGLGPKYYDRGRLAVQADEWEDRIDTVSRAMLGLTVACARCHDHKSDPISTRDYYALAGVFASTRMVNRTRDGSPLKDDLQSTNLPPETLHIVQDSENVRDMEVFLRGNPERKGEIEPRRFLEVLSRGEVRLFRDGSGRKELAACVASAENPLTARVWVNRVWGEIFGRPLVSTPSNFGHSGALPSHPELLDDLAARFMAGGWSVKALVRELVLSSTYAQTSVVESGLGLGATKDPENTWLGRMNRRRLTIEQWRDAMLHHAGQLDFSDGPSQEIDEVSNRRRTVFSRVSRLELNGLLMRFDYPDANVHAEKRGATTTASQKLFQLNSPWVMDLASACARRHGCECGEDGERVGELYRRLFARAPSLEEQTLAADFLRAGGSNGEARWDHYVQALLVSNEMMYVD